MFDSVLICEHRKIFKVCLVIFQNYAWTGWTTSISIIFKFRSKAAFSQEKETPTQVFSSEIYKKFKRTPFFTEQFWRLLPKLRSNANLSHANLSQLK